MDQTSLIPVGAPQFIVVGISVALLAYYTQLIKDFQVYSTKIDKEQLKLHKDLPKISSFPIEVAALLRFVAFLNFLMLVVATGRLYFLPMFDASKKTHSFFDHTILGSLFLQVLILIILSVPFVLRKEYDVLVDDDDDKKKDWQNETEPPEPTEPQSNV